MPDFLTILVILACLAVAAILALGVAAFGRGDDERGERANKFMRLRLLAQFGAVALIVLIALSQA